MKKPSSTGNFVSHVFSARDLVRILGRLLSHLSLHEGDEGATLLGRHSDASDLAKNLRKVARLRLRPENAGKWFNDCLENGEIIVTSVLIIRMLDSMT